jgi:hypothetical protein
MCTLNQNNGGSVMTYESAKEMLKGKTSKRIANNTYLVREGDPISVKLHDTHVVTFWPNNDIVLNSDGWKTVTTKDRMNKYLPDPWHIWQERSIWYVVAGYHGTGYTKWVYQDNCILKPNGEVTGACLYDPEKEKKTAKEIRKINKYAKDYIVALAEGKVPAPDQGDCWFCLFWKTGCGREHIESHIEEKYYVPTLLMNAVDMFPVSMLAMSYLSAIWNNTDDFHSDWLSGIAHEQLNKSLQRYIKRQLGYSA